MGQSAFRVACLLAVGVSLLAFPHRAGAQCTGGTCSDNDGYTAYSIDCPPGCIGGLSSFTVYIPDPPVGYGIYNIWFQELNQETCCFGQSCRISVPPSYGCPVEVLLDDGKPNERFARGLDTPLLFVRGCDGEYSVISLVSKS
jgi:hypothetical protein